MKRLFFFIIVLVVIINLLPPLILKFLRVDDIEIVLSEDKTVRVWFPDEKKARVLPLEEYLTGVVAAEMPASFPPDALKAQVIAARTYTIHKTQISQDLSGNPHKDADVCTSPLCCQAWIPDSEQDKKWGRLNALIYKQKIRKAVADTQGMVITYKNKLIDPVYHSTCGGHTENASEVWKYDAPYLKSVECEFDKNSPKYKTTAQFSFKQLDKILGTKLSEIPKYKLIIVSPVKIKERTSGGRVKSVKIGNKSFSGVELRSKLNLNSANFNIKVDDNIVEFKVTGYGHGVGMCQFGAGGMAKEGSDYENILEHYYKDIKIVKAY